MDICVGDILPNFKILTGFCSQINSVFGPVFFLYTITSLFDHSTGLSGIFIDEHWFYKFKFAVLLANFILILYISMDIEMKMETMKDWILQDRVAGYSSILILEEIKSVGISALMFVLNGTTLAMVKLYLSN